jgi:hypothetical protein
MPGTEYSQAAKTAWLAASTGRMYLRDMVDSKPQDVSDEFDGIFRSGVVNVPIRDIGKLEENSQ